MGDLMGEQPNLMGDLMDVALSDISTDDAGMVSDIITETGDATVGATVLAKLTTSGAKQDVVSDVFIGVATDNAQLIVDISTTAPATSVFGKHVTKSRSPKRSTGQPVRI